MTLPPISTRSRRPSGAIRGFEYRFNGSWSRARAAPSRPTDTTRASAKADWREQQGPCGRQGQRQLTGGERRRSTRSAEPGPPPHSVFPSARRRQQPAPHRPARTAGDRSETRWGSSLARPRLSAGPPSIDTDSMRSAPGSGGLTGKQHEPLPGQHDRPVVLHFVPGGIEHRECARCSALWRDDPQRAAADRRRCRPGSTRAPSDVCP